MASSSSRSSSSSSVPRSEYDVFLSFRGEDIRKTFIGHLYTALDQRGIRTFKDDERLEKGKPVSSELVKNINESSIAVIVFSKNYANSSWCLDELVAILECKRSKKQTVLPIFYDVKPSQVRKQKRSFTDAFEETEKVEKWRAALKEAANLSGLDMEDAANGDEAWFIKQIVQEISKILPPKPFRVADYEVGINARVNKIITLLNKDQLFVGICGIGGAGKTTVAKAVFNRISKNFDTSCFLKNVSKESTKDGGLAKLQTDLLRQTLMDDNITILDHDIGFNEIKDRLHNKMLLLVLDDVDKENTLKYLVGVRQKWFGSGSRIIITTRDKGLLEKYNIKTYDLELLNDSEALQLFCYHAFEQDKPKDDYEELSHHAKDYAKGLPLALQVLGSHLHTKSQRDWSDLLDMWKTDPPEDIHDVLRTSYEGLKEKEKDIFLDIACFFNGRYVHERVMNIYRRNENDWVIEIKILIERCLINIEGNIVSMHDLIQEMGRKIVRQESEDAGERSRLYSYDDISEVFTQNMVTEKIKAIMLPENGLSMEGGLHVRADAFKKMRKLRILQINGVQLVGCLEYLSNDLRYLEWDAYPQEYLPHNFHPKNPVQLHLPNSLIKGIGSNTKFPKMLKVLDLSNCKNLETNLNFSGFLLMEKLYLRHCESLVEVKFDGKFLNKLKIVVLRGCKNLKKTPNLSRLPCLEVFNVESCTNLVEVDPSIEFHESLVELDFRDCKNIKNLATRINLKSLKKLLLSGCSNLQKFPEIYGHMKCLERLPQSLERLKGLEELDLSGCGMLESLPSNIGEMKSLSYLRLDSTGIKKLPSSIAQLTNLMQLYWNNCNLDEESILNLPHSLWHLNLGRNNFVSLPASFTQLTNLENLDLNGCLRLQTLDSLPSSIHRVGARGCVSLERYCIPSSKHHSHDHRSFDFVECHKLVENDGNKKPNIFYDSESEIEESSYLKMVRPGSEIPSWISNIKYENENESKSGEPSVCLRIDGDPNSLRYLKGVYVCAVIGIDHQLSSDEISDPFQIKLKINGRFETDCDLEWYWSENIRSDHIVLFRTTFDNWKYISSGCCIEALNITGHRHSNGRLLRVKKWGIHPIIATKDEYDHKQQLRRLEATKDEYDDDEEEDSEDDEYDDDEEEDSEDDEYDEDDE